jgi:hypothetical protein
MLLSGEALVLAVSGAGGGVNKELRSVFRKSMENQEKDLLVVFVCYNTLCVLYNALCFI